MLHALTRPVSSSIGRCELTHLGRVSIDIELARAQHAAYCDTLSGLGVEVIRLPHEESLPDSVFVEDAAVVTDEVAVLTRPGAPSRRPEVDSVGAALAPFRPTRRIEAPATLDGGDVVIVGRRVWVGNSTRTNGAGITQLGELLEPFGYSVRGVELGACLHLKSAVTAIGDDTVLLDRSMLDPQDFGGVKIVCSDPSEPLAANAVRVGDGLLLAASAPRTASRVRALGFRVTAVDATELAKAEGALTCCSILFEA